MKLFEVFKGRGERSEQVIKPVLPPGPEGDSQAEGRVAQAILSGEGPGDAAQIEKGMNNAGALENLNNSLKDDRALLQERERRKTLGLE